MPEMATDAALVPAVGADDGFAPHSGATSNSRGSSAWWPTYSAERRAGARYP